MKPTIEYATPLLHMGFACLIKIRKSVSMQRRMCFGKKNRAFLCTNCQTFFVMPLLNPLLRLLVNRREVPERIEALISTNLTSALSR